jgi:hypothetical protein
MWAQWWHCLTQLQRRGKHEDHELDSSLGKVKVILSQKQNMKQKG